MTTLVTAYHRAAGTLTCGIADTGNGIVKVVLNTVCLVLSNIVYLRL